MVFFVDVLDLNQFIEYAAVMVQLSDAQDWLQTCHTFADEVWMSQSYNVTKSKQHINCTLWPAIACSLLWPVMASKKFCLSRTSSQDSPGYRDPTLNLFLNLTSELLAKPTLLAILRSLARHCSWSFGGILEDLRLCLYTIFILNTTLYPLYLRNSLG